MPASTSRPSSFRLPLEAQYRCLVEDVFHKPLKTCEISFSPFCCGASRVLNAVGGGAANVTKRRPVTKMAVGEQKQNFKIWETSTFHEVVLLSCSPVQGRRWLRGLSVREHAGSY